MTAADRERWDAKYVGKDVPETLQPPDWLVKHASGLKPGRALDLACGVGQTAVWLAMRGWDVTAIDISPVRLAAAQKLAEAHHVDVNWIAADLDDADLGQGEFDLITVFRFLDRQTLPRRIVTALRPGGWLLYETFLADESTPSTRHLRNPAFLLRPGELAKHFADLTVVEYGEQRGSTEATAALAAIKLQSIIQ